MRNFIHFAAVIQEISANSTSWERLFVGRPIQVRSLIIHAPLSIFLSPFVGKSKYL